MADLRCAIAGIKSPNPFWLASAPPTDKKYNVVRAFQAGWGGAVWKTLGEDPPIVNTCLALRRGAYNGARMAGFNNIELITDRPLEVNLQRDQGGQARLAGPGDHRLAHGAVHEERNWQAILARSRTPARTASSSISAARTACPSAAWARRWARCRSTSRWSRAGQAAHPHAGVRQAHAERHQHPGAGPRRQEGRRRRGLADQHHQLDHVGVDLDTMAPTPTVDGKGAHGGYCGPAVKPIALHMVGEIARDPRLPRRADLRHRRHRDLARRGRVHRPRRAAPCRSAPAPCTTASGSSRT